MIQAIRRCIDTLLRFPALTGDDPSSTSAVLWSTAATCEGVAVACERLGSRYMGETTWVNTLVAWNIHSWWLEREKNWPFFRTFWGGMFSAVFFFDIILKTRNYGNASSEMATSFSSSRSIQVHSRNAEAETLEILARYDVPGVFWLWHQTKKNEQWKKN